MAVYEVPYVCGHKVKQKIYGTWARRDLYLQELRTKNCPNCRDALLPVEERPTLHVFFLNDLTEDAADILLTNCKPLRDQIYYSRRHYQFVTERDCEELAIKKVGWWKRVKPADKVFEEANFAYDIGIRNLDYINEPPQEIHEVLHELDAP
jgi:hypothetical protein